jgi:hypothetical protein
MTGCRIAESKKTVLTRIAFSNHVGKSKCSGVSTDGKKDSHKLGDRLHHGVPGAIATSGAGSD